MLFIAFAVISGVMLSAGTAAARTPYDGNWSVSIWTDRGSCDRGYRYEVRVDNGKVSYRGEGSFNVSGRVDSGGRVNVTISHGERRASGAGRLSRNSGRGSWKGKSAMSECSGTWEAERR
jgi:hypothetical protein